MAIAGRLTPLIRPIRNSADAIVAPVLPAEIIAPARPSRTASAARTSVESFLRRIADGRVVVHPDDLGGLDQVEDGAVGGLPPVEVGWPDEHDGDSVGDGGMRAGEVRAGSVVAAHGVESNGEHGGQRQDRRVS